MARIFRPAGPAVVRVATLPRTDADRTAVDLAPHEPGYPERLRHHVTTLTADPLVAEALAVSSGPLWESVRRIRDGGPADVPRLERAALAVSRYLLRMSGRATPFGLMAGVAPLTIGGPAQVRIGDRHVRQVRADHTWMASVLARAWQVPAVREASRVSVNTLCRVRGDRLVLTATSPAVSPAAAPSDPAAGEGPVPGTSPDHSHGEATDHSPAADVSLALTPVVRAVLDLAAAPTDYLRLRADLAESFGVEDPTALDAMLGTLVNRGILLTDLTGRRDGADPLAEALTRLVAVDDPVVDGLRRVDHVLARYAATPAGQGLEAWADATAELRRWRTGTEGIPIQVDLRADADVRLPRQVADELGAAADALWRMAPPTRGPQPLATYHRDFLERYGPQALVPVLEVLDPHLGLGPPPGYRRPVGDGGALEPDSEGYPGERDELLASLTMDALREGQDEIVLDDATIGLLGHDAALPPPPSLDLCAELHATSTEAIDRGDFRLVLSAGVGSFAAGSMIGRFATMLSAEEDLGRLLLDRPDAEDAVLAQLTFAPLDPRHDNIARVPIVLPHVVCAGGVPGPGTADVVDVRNLAVGATADRLFLTVPGSGREVVVVAPHMLNLLHAAPNVARFLVGMGFSGTRPWSRWQWGSLAALPYLPRVRYRRTVLSPARWLLPREVRDHRLSLDRWEPQFARWRERLKVPPQVRLVRFDNHLDLDLDAALHRRILRQQMSRPVPLMLTDAGTRQEGWADEHAVEIVVPFLATRRRPPPPLALSRAAGHTVHLPGGEWLFATIGAARESQDGLLRRELGTLVGQLPPVVDRWFFIRYRDPRSHLRLRFHGEPAALRARLLPVLHDWADAACAAGAIAGMRLDAYRPEEARYGTAEAMEAAERLFHQDSLLVLGQLRERAAGRLPVAVEVLAAMNYVDLLASLGEWDWQSWVLRRFPQEVHRHARAHRRAALTLVDPQREWQQLGDLPGSDGVRASWDRRAEAAAKYGAFVLPGPGSSDGPGTAPGDGYAIESLLHLHANRLIGPDQALEVASLGVLRTAVLAHVERGRSGDGHA